LLFHGRIKKNEQQKSISAPNSKIVNCIPKNGDLSFLPCQCPMLFSCTIKVAENRRRAFSERKESEKSKILAEINKFENHIFFRVVIFLATGSKKITIFKVACIFVFWIPRDQNRLPCDFQKVRRRNNKAGRLKSNFHFST
jgi:hypothetical protein